MSVAPVAITGMGCICAAGGTLPECMESLFRGTRAPAPPARFSSTHPVRYPVFEVPGFEGPPDVIRTAALGLAAAREAVSDAGLDPDALSGMRVGVCVGTTVGCVLSDEAFCREHLAGRDPEMAPFLRILRSNPAEVIARELGLSGPLQTVVNACSSGTDAVGIAGSWIRAGLCDAAVAGGADELGRIAYIGFISLMITDDSPCRPFDRNRKGLNLGEGAAMLVLESERSRGRRGTKARSFLLGYGSAGDAHHLTAPHPDGAGLKGAVAEALSSGGRAPAGLAFVNAHGTGTPDNDRVESRVLRDLFPGVPYHSTKGYTGHTLGAAGAIEAVFTASCLELGKIPASAGFETPDPEIPNPPVREATPVRGTAALSESLAFGGNNSAVVLGKG
ncbi:MAG: Beta-ketoacyl synthase [Deltaproteobacteria bacterium]|nr:Beta-ketoacyl synthase [Deltaproteobacteria bacterium]